jgi:phosphotransferase system HPr (HPr) family protein
MTDGPNGTADMKTAPLTISVTIVHPQGIHLRVGKDLAYVANRFESTATARNLTLSTPAVDLKSILQIMRLQARIGHVIQLTTDGPDAEEAIAALRTVLECPRQNNHE